MWNFLGASLILLIILRYYFNDTAVICIHRLMQWGHRSSLWICMRHLSWLFSYLCWLPTMITLSWYVFLVYCHFLFICTIIDTIILLINIWYCYNFHNIRRKESLEERWHTAKVPIVGGLYKSNSILGVLVQLLFPENPVTLDTDKKIALR